MESSGEPTTGTPPDPARLGGSRRPGWFPDESRPDRFRHWDGGSWNAMIAANPVWGPEDEPRDRAGSVRSRTIRGAVAVAAALVLIAGAGFVVNAGGDDEVAADRVATGTDDNTEILADRLERDDEDRNNTGGSDGARAEPDGSNDSAGSNGNGSGSSSGGGAGGGAGAPGDGSGPGGASEAGGTGGGGPVGSPSPDLGDGGGPADLADCESLDTELQAILRSFPGLESVSRTMTIDEVRCNTRWASGMTTSAVTPRSLAVFERQGGRWALVAYGTNEPCRQLALSDPLAEQLRCR